MISNDTLKNSLYFDIETCGLYSDYDELRKHNPRLGELWKKRAEWLRKHFPHTNAEMTDHELFLEKSSLHPEFGRIICVTFGHFDKDMNTNVKSYYGMDEKEILTNSFGVINKVTKNNWKIAGHTIGRFDVPFMGKRMLINRINPPKAFRLHEVKPWESSLLDIATLWSFGAWQEGFTSLDLMTGVLEVDSPKADMDGSKVHEVFWQGGIDRIVTYCENDVRATMECFQKLAF